MDEQAALRVLESWLSDAADDPPQRAKVDEAREILAAALEELAGWRERHEDQAQGHHGKRVRG